MVVSASAWRLPFQIRPSVASSWTGNAAWLTSDWTNWDIRSVIGVESEERAPAALQPSVHPVLLGCCRRTVLAGAGAHGLRDRTARRALRHVVHLRPDTHGRHQPSRVHLGEPG